MKIKAQYIHAIELIQPVEENVIIVDHNGNTLSCPDCSNKEFYLIIKEEDSSINIVQCKKCLTISSGVI